MLKFLKLFYILTISLSSFQQESTTPPPQESDIAYQRRQYFELSDLNHDNLLDISEIRKAMPTLSENELSMLMSSFDTNQDGVLDYNEYLVIPKQGEEQAYLEDLKR